MGVLQVASGVVKSHSFMGALQVASADSTLPSCLSALQVASGDSMIPNFRVWWAHEMLCPAGGLRCVDIPTVHECSAGGLRGLNDPQVYGTVGA